MYRLVLLLKIYTNKNIFNKFNAFCNLYLQERLEFINLTWVNVQFKVLISLQ